MRKLEFFAVLLGFYQHLHCLIGTVLFQLFNGIGYTVKKQYVQAFIQKIISF